MHLLGGTGGEQQNTFAKRQRQRHNSSYCPSSLLTSRTKHGDNDEAKEGVEEEEEDEEEAAGRGRGADEAGEGGGGQRKDALCQLNHDEVQLIGRKSYDFKQWSKFHFA